MTQDITYITDACLITCVVSTGKGDTVLKVARELGVAGGVVFQGRGTGVRERLGLLGVAVEADKEVIMMMVANDRRDILIESIFKTSEMNVLAAGFIYATPLDRAAVYVPDSVLEQQKTTDSNA